MRLFELDAGRIEGLGRASANALRAFEQLRQRPVTGIPELSERAGVAFQTAARAVDALERLGIVREVTGRKRDRVYAYQQYLTILNEGPEPL